MASLSPDFFEGAEKRLDVEFKCSSDNPRGLRMFSRLEWIKLLDTIKCSVIAEHSNEHADSYVLSESSLFVFSSKVVLKTCGTTPLLLCMEQLLEMAKRAKATVSFVAFSRKSFMAPKQQQYPHVCFTDEVSYLNKYFEGQGHSFGDTERWHLYIAQPNKSHTPALGRYQNFELMMTSLDRASCDLFYADGTNTADKITKKTGLSTVISTTQPNTGQFLFEPCGYSVNGLSDKRFFTVHVTPQPDFSFASFETNATDVEYSVLMRKVLQLFKPKTFLLTLVLSTESNLSASTALGFAPSALNYKIKRAFSKKYSDTCTAVMYRCTLAE